MPGRLIHTNIAASAIFAATSGSSVATAATIGTVAIPNMDKGGYNRPLFLGSIAAGGTLGILIPPSINMIIYAVLTDTSVADLYAAGFIPGFMLAGLFSLMVLRRSPPGSSGSGPGRRPIPEPALGGAAGRPAAPRFRRSACSWSSSARSMPASRPRRRRLRSA